MTERIRKKLMNQNLSRKWGDTPGTNKSQQIQEAPQSTPRHTSAPIAPNAQSPSSFQEMQYVVEKAPLARNFVSCKGWTVESIVKRGSNFNHIKRVSATDPNLSSIIESHEKDGVPLVIEGWHKHPKWPKPPFSLQDFQTSHLRARNIRNWSDVTLSFDEFIAKLREMPPFATPEESERLYGKDALCPEKWDDWLQNSGAIPSRLLHHSANDLLSHMPIPVETLMCYIGISDTYTSCHKDLCGSSGQNLMCYSEKSGSAFWFMTKSSAAPAAAKFFQELSQELDHETHALSIEELSRAPFSVYVVEQKLGDMVLIPPRSCHQVVNSGGITVKTSWSRMTLDGLLAAYYQELPIYRRVCRAEIYKVKDTIYHTLCRLTRDLEALAGPEEPEDSASSEDDSLYKFAPTSSARLDRSMAAENVLLSQELHRVVEVFDDILHEEYGRCANIPCLNYASPKGALKEQPTDNITCDYCAADIFQGFFECRTCIASPAVSEDGSTTEVALGDGLVICPSCYVEGRTCKCRVMHPAQCRAFEDILRDRNAAAKVLMRTNKSTGISMLEEKDLTLKKRVQIFAAGCELQRTRKSNTSNHSCTCTLNGRGPLSHEVPFASRLDCEKCKSRKCYSCILTDYHIHSAEAILTHRLDEQSVSWHKRHCRKDARDAEESLNKSEKNGARCDHKYQLAKLARQFPTCKPVNSTFTNPGWYDKFVQVDKVPTNASAEYSQETTVDGGFTNQDTSAPPSPLTPLPRTMEVEEISVVATRPAEQNKTASSSVSKKRKSTSAYVLLPPRRREVLKKPKLMPKQPGLKRKRKDEDEDKTLESRLAHHSAVTKTTAKKSIETSLPSPPMDMKYGPPKAARKLLKTVASPTPTESSSHFLGERVLPPKKRPRPLVGPHVGASKKQVEKSSTQSDKCKDVASGTRNPAPSPSHRSEDASVGKVPERAFIRTGKPTGAVNTRPPTLSEVISETQQASKRSAYELPVIPTREYTDKAAGRYGTPTEEASVARRIASRSYSETASSATTETEKSSKRSRSDAEWEKLFEEVKSQMTIVQNQVQALKAQQEQHYQEFQIWKEKQSLEANERTSHQWDSHQDQKRIADLEDQLNLLRASTRASPPNASQITVNFPMDLHTLAGPLALQRAYPNQPNRQGRSFHPHPDFNAQVRGRPRGVAYPHQSHGRYSEHHHGRFNEHHHGRFNEHHHGRVNEHQSQPQRYGNSTNGRGPYLKPNNRYDERSEHNHDRNNTRNPNLNGRNSQRYDTSVRSPGTSQLPATYPSISDLHTEREQSPPSPSGRSPSRRDSPAPHEQPQPPPPIQDAEKQTCPSGPSPSDHWEDDYEQDEGEKRQSSNTGDGYEDVHNPWIDKP